MAQEMRLAAAHVLDELVQKVQNSDDGKDVNATEWMTKAA